MVLGSDSQSFRGWECHEGEKKWSTNACPYLCHVLLSPFPFSFYYLVFFCSLVLSFFRTFLPMFVCTYSWLPLFLV